MFSACEHVTCGVIMVEHHSTCIYLQSSMDVISNKCTIPICLPLDIEGLECFIKSTYYRTILWVDVFLSSPSLCINFSFLIEILWRCRALCFLHVLPVVSFCLCSVWIPDALRSAVDSVGPVLVEDVGPGVSLSDLRTTHALFASIALLSAFSIPGVPSILAGKQLPFLKVILWPYAKLSVCLVCGTPPPAV